MACHRVSAKPLSETMLLLLIGPMGINISEILIEISTHLFKNMYLKLLPGKWQPFCLNLNVLTHWGWVTHICVVKLTIIGSDNGLSPRRRQAIIWTNAGILLIGPLGTNFSEILIEIQTFSLKKIRLKMSPAKCCSFRLGLNVTSGNPEGISQPVYSASTFHH